MEMDFFADMAALMRAELSAAGYGASPGDDRKDVLTYYAAAHRFIPPRPRQTHVAPSLVCPTEVQAGYQLILQKVANGDPLRPHQSKLAANADYNDGLLNDWGIDHFHLGTTLRADGWIERSGPLLYARVTSSDFYCIAIQAHGAWTQQQMIETVHANWPSTIAATRIQGIVDLVHVPTDADVKTLRGAQINTFLKMADGTIYGPPGLGYSLSGVSTAAALKTTRMVRDCRDMEAAVREQMAGDVGNMLRQAGVKDEGVEFHLMYDNKGRLCAVEKTSRIALSFGELPLPPVR